MLLKILYGVRGDVFCPFVRIWVKYSKNMTIIDRKIDFCDSDFCTFGAI